MKKAWEWLKRQKAIWAGFGLLLLVWVAVTWRRLRIAAHQAKIETERLRILTAYTERVEALKGEGSAALALVERNKDRSLTVLATREAMLKEKTDDNAAALADAINRAWMKE